METSERSNVGTLKRENAIMATIQRFEEIEAWKTARLVTREIYRVSNQGAFARDFGLRDQTRRTAVSIVSNIAEGFESHTQALFISYLGRGKASAGELCAQLSVALDTGYLTQSQFDPLFDQVDKCSRQLSRCISYLQSQPNSRPVRETTIGYGVEDVV